MSQKGYASFWLKVGHGNEYRNSTQKEKKKTEPLRSMAE
jgi:hypothetical protein